MFEVSTGTCGQVVSAGKGASAYFPTIGLLRFLRVPKKESLIPVGEGIFVRPNTIFPKVWEHFH